MTEFNIFHATTKDEFFKLVATLGKEEGGTDNVFEFLEDHRKKVMEREKGNVPPFITIMFPVIIMGAGNIMDWFLITPAKPGEEQPDFSEENKNIILTTERKNILYSLMKQFGSEDHLDKLKTILTIEEVLCSE